jgi:AcrR family transcriptional regulator
MAARQARAPKGSRRGTLSREGIVRAAVTLADREGLHHLSMRALAKDLGVEAMSLYHHVSSKEDVLDGMVDHVVDEMHLPEIGSDDWRGELRRRSVSGREVLLRHPWAVGLMDSRRSAGMSSLRHHDAVIGCLREAGFSLAMVSHAFALLDAHLYGFMVQELSLPTTDDVGLGDLAAEILGSSLDQLPHMAEFTRDYVLQPGYRFGDEFEVGLDMVLDVLESRLPTP